MRTNYKVPHYQFSASSYFSTYIHIFSWPDRSQVPSMYAFWYIAPYSFAKWETLQRYFLPPSSGRLSSWWRRYASLKRQSTSPRLNGQYPRRLLTSRTSPWKVKFHPQTMTIFRVELQVICLFEMLVMTCRTTWVRFQVLSDTNIESTVFWRNFCRLHGAISQQTVVFKTIWLKIPEKQNPNCHFRNNLRPRIISVPHTMFFSQSLIPILIPA